MLNFKEVTEFYEETQKIKETYTKQRDEIDKQLKKCNEEEKENLKDLVEQVVSDGWTRIELYDSRHGSTHFFLCPPIPYQPQVSSTFLSLESYDQECRPTTPEGVFFFAVQEQWVEDFSKGAVFPTLNEGEY
jgi:hypothetical protein